MIFSQLHTRQHPFPNIIMDHQVTSEVLRGSRPSKPAAPTSALDRFWEVLEPCWDPDSQSRPSARSLASSLPLRIPELYPLTSADLHQVCWKASTSGSPSGGPPDSHHIHRDPQHTVDLPLLNYLDLSTSHGKTLHEITQRLTALGCPVDVVQFIRGGAASIHERGRQLRSRGRYEEAIGCLSRAVEIQGIIARDSPEEVNSDLASSLHQLADCHNELWNFNDAVLYG